MQIDFDFMTEEVGRLVKVYPRQDELTYAGQEAIDEDLGLPTEEVALVQELNTTHEVVASGALKVGDVRFTFKSDTVAEEEGYVIENGIIYKILDLTYVKGMSQATTVYVKAFGKKIPER